MENQFSTQPPTHESPTTSGGSKEPAPGRDALELTEAQVETLRELADELCGGCAYGLQVVVEKNSPYCHHWHKPSPHESGWSLQGCGADKLWQIVGLP